MIRFTKIRWKNLLSTGNAFTEIDLTAARTTLILGENGSGKSTLLDALCFALFGRPYRDINKPQLLNAVNGKKCEVEVEFTVGKKAYKIIRGIKPATFEIYLDGELINQDAASRDYQKYLEESVLKMNFKSFTQIVILGSAGFVPFMQLPAKERRTIIEDILDIQIFTIMNMLLKQKVKEVGDEHLQLSRDLELAKQKAIVQDKYIKSLAEDSQSQLDKVIEEQIILTKKLEVLEHELAEQDEIVAKLETTKALYEHEDRLMDKLNDKQVDIEKEIKILRRQIDHQGTLTHCSVCGQDIAKSHKDKHIKELTQKLKVLEKELASVLKAIQPHADKMEKWEPVLEDLTKAHADKMETSTQIRITRSLLQGTAKRVKDIQNRAGNLKEETAKLKELAKEVMAVNKKRSAATEEKFYLEVAGSLLKDSGIKTRIMEQYLPVINKMVNKYLAEMDFFVQFTLDNELKEVIKSRYRDEFTYASFSEGEKKRIDLAIMLTFRGIAKLKNSCSTNLLIMDEILDGSLDSAATEFVMQLLNVLGNEAHVFVISHNSDNIADKFEQILQFKKVQNFSVISKAT